MSITMTIIVYTSVGTIGIYLVALYFLRAQPALTDVMSRMSGPAPAKASTARTSLVDGLANKLGLRVHPYLQDSRFLTLPTSALPLLNKAPTPVPDTKNRQHTG